MKRTDPRLDAYIANAAPFAQPILQQLRKVVHAACPEVEETMKWSFPHFDYKGILCGMASFKEHCSLGFWKASLIFGGDQQAEREGMGNFGRITALSDLPSEKVLIGYVRKAAQLNEAGVKIPRSPRPAKQKPLAVPQYFTDALRNNKKAQKTFEKFTPSARREYIVWVTEAKREATRESRLATAIEWMAEGKVLNWRYQPK